MAAKTEFSVKGPIFKLALELGENPLRYVGSKPQSKPTMSMADVAALVESGRYAWCAYIPEYHQREMKRWHVGVAAGSWNDHVEFLAPAAEDLSALRSKSLEQAALAKATKGAAKTQAGAVANSAKKPASATLVKALLAAIAEDDLEEVAKLAPLAAHGLSAKRHPLVEAAAAGKTDALELLLPHADPESKGAPKEDNDGNWEGFTWRALHAAAAGGSDACVKLLLDAGADANAKDDNGDSALCWAIEKKHFKVVKTLLAWPATDANLRDKIGDSPLGLAAICRMDDTVKLLLTKPGVDAKAKNADGRSPLFLAALHVRPDSVKALMPYSDPNARDNDGNTPLMAALTVFATASSSDWRFREGLIACVDALLPATDLPALDKDGRTLFTWALALESKGGPYGSRFELVNYFDVLLQKTGPNRADAHGDTALTLVAGRSRQRVEELLAAGADPRHSNAAGDSALIIAARAVNLSIVRLLAPVSDANAKGAGGRTALMECLQGFKNSGNQIFDQILCALRLLPLSDADARDELGNTALMLAVDGAPLELFEALLAKADPDLQNNAGETALLLAIKKRSEEPFEALLRVADVSLGNHQGLTPLMRAATTFGPFMEQLLGKGADAGAVDLEGLTSLHWAVSEERDRDGHVKLLLPLSDILAKTSGGKTALELAKKHGLKKSVKLIEPMDRALREREAIKPPDKKKAPIKPVKTDEPTEPTKRKPRETGL